MQENGRIIHCKAMASISSAMARSMKAKCKRESRAARDSIYTQMETDTLEIGLTIASMALGRTTTMKRETSMKDPSLTGQNKATESTPLPTETTMKAAFITGSVQDTVTYRIAMELLSMLLSSTGKSQEKQRSVILTKTTQRCFA